MQAGERPLLVATYRAYGLVALALLRHSIDRRNADLLEDADGFPCDARSILKLVSEP